MKLTTKDIIKILPFDDAFKQDLLSRFDALDAGQRFNLEQILWSTYDAFFELRLQANIEIELDRATKQNGVLGKDFYDRVREQTKKEMQGEASATVAQMDLTSTREKLEELMKKPTNG